MSKIPDFEGLAMFAKVAEEGSFAAAARTLGVSVATMSRGVTRLEERLGARLLNRSSRQLALTGFGQTVAESATRIYRDAEATEGAARELSVQPRGLIKFAAPMSFGLRWVAPLLPEFFALYPEVSVDLHLSDAAVDLVGEGFDAALRIAVLPDSALVARKLCSVSQVLLAAPSYLARHGEPAHPSELGAHACMAYAYRARSASWRFTSKDGEEVSIVPNGPLRVNNADALVPAALAGLAICELPEFMAADHVRSGQLQPLLTDWAMATGGVYFVRPSARAKPAKVEALANFLADRLSAPDWQLTERR